jgi:hypothetical protein
MCHPPAGGRGLTDSFAGLADGSGTLQALRELASAAQHDEHVAAALAGFTAERRAVLRALLGRGRERAASLPPARTWTCSWRWPTGSCGTGP